ncbi:MAG: M28 family metallopeptidase [Proteobacteria bacterium]|nr:M28 family metallopeptidase [Pseudomonadota bacterium]
MFKFYFLFSLFILSGAYCRSQHNPLASDEQVIRSWNQQRLKTHLETLSQEPHPLGSDRQAFLANWLQKTATDAGFEAVLDPFTATVPDPTIMNTQPSLMQSLSLDLKAYNVYAKLKVPGKDCVIMLGSHFDSKRLEKSDSRGANDSGSSSAALLEILPALTALKDSGTLSCGILLVWFDGEEATLLNWRDGQDHHPAKIQDNLYGSRHLAQKLEPCGTHMCLPKNLGGEQLRAFILLDMIGMPKAQLTVDSSSHPKLMQRAQALDASKFGGKLYRKAYPKAIEDDHWPFMERGIPSIDLIDFENLQTWHQPSDRLESLDLDSIKNISRLAMALILELNENQGIGE